MQKCIFLKQIKNYNKHATKFVLLSSTTDLKKVAFNVAVNVVSGTSKDSLDKGVHYSKLMRIIRTHT